MEDKEFEKLRCEPVPVLPSSIEREQYSQYMESEKLRPSSYGTDYTMTTKYKNGDKVTVGMDFIFIENPPGEIIKWWETREEEKKELKDIIKDEFPLY